MGIWNTLVEKFNPSQPLIRNSEPGGSRTTKDPYTLSNAYREVELVNRAVNMFVDSCAEVTYDVKGKFTGVVSHGSGVRQDQLQKLLNIQPNPYMDISLFKRLVFMDLIMEGAAYIYWDGAGLYPLPASQMEVVMDKRQFINKFIFAGKDEYKPSQIIFIKDNCYYGTTVFTSGFSRLSSSLSSIKRLNKLATFKEKFYDNGAVLGLVIETDQLLSKRHKQRYEEETSIRYNPSTGKSSILVLDGGFKAKSVSNTSFRDMGTKEDQDDLRSSIAIAMGIPPILFDSGNNANIRPNVELFYSMTVMPALRKLESAFEFFFGYDIKPMTDDVMALAPDKKIQSEYVSSLVNNGILTGNEGRELLRFAVLEEEQMKKIRIPQNVAGSGTGVSGQEGGKPPKKEEDK
jgi:HK97 family phage portal protein